MNKTTIVSGFISINTYRSIEKYIEYGKILMNSKLPKIIFIDNEIYEKYYKNLIFANTQFILTNKSELYLYQYKDQITKFNINTNNPTKDTIDYICIICNKTEWMKQAIEMNTYNTEQFVWIDFGIYHIFSQMNIDVFYEKLEKLYSKSYENVRIASCWDINQIYMLDIYKDIAWYFAGGVFGGNKNKLKEFSDLMKQKCIELITDKHHIMWEVNIWYLIYLSNKKLFNSYMADHNSSIIDNY